MSVLHTLGIDKMSLDERLQLVQEIWDSIADERGSFELTQAQKDELDRRLAADEADPNRGSPWEEVKARLLSRKT